VYSAVINVDIGCTLFLWASLLAYLRYEETGRTRLLVVAGALGAVSVAFKFPGAVILPLLWVAIWTSPRTSPGPKARLKECAIVAATLVVVMTAIAPEWIPRIGWTIHYNFPWLFDAPGQVTIAGGDDVEGDIRSITTATGGWKLRYVEHLLNPYNVALTAFAVVAMVAGVAKRRRWDAILGGLVVVFVAVMSASSRTQPERYLLPIVPALWLLGGLGVSIVARGRPLPAALCIALMIAMPAYLLVRAVVEKSKMDTRVLAKAWIEENVPSGSRILMDGMQYRFSQSPPLNPSEDSVERKVQRASKEGAKLGRGVSDLALSVYREAKGRTGGPTYEITSTVHGLQVRPIGYYAENCVDYVVTSSMISDRFAPGGRGSEKFPASVRFYASLGSDARVRKVHVESPQAWKSSGPTIAVYELQNACRGRSPAR
jgi:hypothetical protein